MEENTAVTVDELIQEMSLEFNLPVEDGSMMRTYQLPSLPSSSDYFDAESRICIARLIECNRLKYTGYSISSQYERFEDNRSNRGELHRLLSRDSE